VYYIYSVKDRFKLPAERLEEDIESVAASVLRRKYEGTVDKDAGVIVAIFNIRNISDGVLYPGDPSTHHDVEFDALTFMPNVEEIVDGEVTEIAEFGAFVRIGPIDGLVHVSQITNDFLSFDRKAQAFVSKRSGRTLKKGDAVFAKISTISMKNSVKDSKIALTMKPEGLGKPEWLGEDEKAKSRQGGKDRRRPR
jgi:DNA-directed RNA polymerase subunit E'